MCIIRVRAPHLSTAIHGKKYPNFINRSRCFLEVPELPERIGECGLVNTCHSYVHLRELCRPGTGGINGIEFFPEIILPVTGVGQTISVTNPVLSVLTRMAEDTPNPQPSPTPQNAQNPRREGPRHHGRRPQQHNYRQPAPRPEEKPAEKPPASKELSLDDEETEADRSAAPPRPGSPGVADGASHRSGSSRNGPTISTVNSGAGCSGILYFLFFARFFPEHILGILIYNVFCSDFF